MRIRFDHPALGASRPGLYIGSRRILPIAAPHGYNEKRDDVKFQMPNWLRTLGMYCEPDFVIGGISNPYLLRWWLLPRNRRLSAYLHRFLRSDDDRALHDHPWDNVSIVLKGSYIEEMPALGAAGSPYTRLFDLPRRRILRTPGSIVYRRATDSHRIELINGQSVTTLFLTGRVVRNWGFHCAQGWIPWQDFVGADPGAIGKGCGEGAPGTHRA